MMKIEFKDKFVERYSKLTDFEAFKDSVTKPLRRSLRVNTLKSDINSVKKRLFRWKLTQVPWCREGFWAEHEEGRRDIGNTIEHSLGYIYIQEAASMIPPVVLDPKPGEAVLDMCAAPGSKTTQIAQYMKNSGILIANDYKGMRIAPLGINAQRCGASNIVITLQEGRHFSGNKFDRILIDAPCSGTGTISKSLKTLRIWNPNVIKRLAGAQRQLIKTAFLNLKAGGVMVYSTCSLEPEEDEAVVSHLLDSFPEAVVEGIELPGLVRGEPVTEFLGKRFNDEVKKTLRIWPQDNGTEGFFVAKIRKPKG